MTERIERIVVVGRDVQAWISALAIHRAFGHERVQVTVLELETTLLGTDVVAAVPSIADLHRLLGIDDQRILHACNGVPMVAQRFANWGRSAATFLHGYDPATGPERDFSFVHYWVRARDQGMHVPYDDFSAAAAAAKQGRIPASSFGFDADLSPPAYGYQLDARDYAASVKQLAIKQGIDFRTGRLTGVTHEGDRIASVEWDSGDTFLADLYIDASGPEAALIRSMPGAEFESWSKWFGADQLVSASAPALSPLPAFANIVAFRGGWLGIHPLQNRTAVLGAISSHIADMAMLDNLPVLAGVPIDGEVAITRFNPGIRRRAWIGNCVALGAAAADLEPLDSALLHFLYVGIGHLLGELSASTDPLAQAEVFNRNLARAAEGIRDFQLAHYRLNSRFDEPFWDRARDSSGPSSLEARVAAFQRDGSVSVADDEPFQETNWAAVMIGHGVIPQSYAPWVDQMPEEQHMAIMQRRLRSIATAVNAMPSVEQFLTETQPAVSA